MSRPEFLATPQFTALFGAERGSLSHFGLTNLNIVAAVNEIPFAELEFTSALSPEALAGQIDADLKNSAPGMRMIVHDKAGVTLFDGVIVDQSYSVIAGRARIAIYAAHPLVKLSLMRTSRVHRDQTDGEILLTRLATAELPVEGGESLDTPWAQLVQFDSTDWRFAVDRAEALGVWLIPGWDMIRIVRPQLGEAPQLTIDPKAAAENAPLMEGARWAFRVQPSGVSLSTWSIGEQEMSVPATASEPRIGQGCFDASRLARLSSTADEYAGAFSWDEAARSNWAGGQLQMARGSGARGQLTLAGTSGVAIGQTVRLSGFGSGLDGMALVSGVRQLGSQGYWRTIVELGRAPPPQYRALRASDSVPLLLGVVAEPIEDPEDFHRVRVRIPSWPGQPELWARWASPYASRDSGFCLFPDVGDEVVLAFVDGDPSNLLVMGSLFSPVNAPPIAYPETIAQKGLVIAGEGMRLGMLLDKEAKKLSLSSSENMLSLDAESFALEASAAMSIKAGESIAVEASGATSIDTGDFSVTGEAVSVAAPTIEFSNE